MAIRVGPFGPKNAKIAFVGEAPGGYEVRVGEPFVGPAGTLLSRIMSNAGILRSSCYMTNVVKEQPPKTYKKTNDISVFVDLSKTNPIETDKYREYKESLRVELEGIDAKVLVAFGNVPLYALTGIHPPKITKRRGSVYPCTLVPSKKVVACIHPAACIHSGRTGGKYIWQYLILRDLKKAVREAEVDGIIEMPFDYAIGPSYQEAVDYLKYLKDKAKVVAYDIEVMNLEVSCMSFADRIGDRGYSMSIPFIYEGVSYMTPDQEAEIWRLSSEILEDPNIKVIGQNIIFDSQFIFRKYGIIINNIDDTMIAQAIVSPDMPKGLDFITSIYTDEPYYKDEGKLYMKFGGSERSFWLYNAKDSAICIEAMPVLKNDLRVLDNIDVYEEQKRLVEPLIFMSEHGIRMDIDNLKKKSAEVGDELERLREEFVGLCGYDVNPASPKQLKDYFYGVKGYSPYKKRGTGKPTVDENALKRLSRKGSKEARILLDIRRLSKLKGTYLDVKLDDDGRLRCSFNPVGAADSGRLSSSKTIWGTGMNIQNDPPEVKKFMIADKGHVIYNIDLAQAENRIVAYCAGEYKMMEAFESGSDVHSLTASLIFDDSVEEIKKENEMYNLTHDPKYCCSIGQGNHPRRFWGKKANHGLNYGLGYKTFAFYYEIPESDARHIVARYHQAYPGIRGYHAMVQEELRQNRRVTNLFGRTRLFLERWGDGLFKEAYSFIPQSTVADIINRRGISTIYYDKSNFKHVILLNQVHDSVVLEIPLSIGWEAHATILWKIKRSLEQELVWRGRRFVIPADLEMGYNMQDTREVKWTTNLTKDLERTSKQILSKR